MARRPRRSRPRCQPLEDRCLLSVSLTDSTPPLHLAGLPVVWTAMSDGHGTTPVYQFRVGPTGGESRVVQDFSTDNTLKWNPIQEGSYTIRVTVKNGFGTTIGESAFATYTAQSRAVGSVAVVGATSNPLVALYSAPPSAGTSMYVQFSPTGPSPSWTSTAPRPIVPGRSTNLLVAGLRPNTTYLMRHVLDDGTASAPVGFTTGALPTNLAFPNFSVPQPAAPGTDPTQGTILHFAIATSANAVNTIATDLEGRIVWYYDPVANGYTFDGTALVTGGTLLLFGQPSSAGTGGSPTMREIDLAGDTLRRTNIDAVNAQLAALGLPSITNFSHDIQRLPNGDTAVLASTNRLVNLHGTPTTYVGDMVLVLNRDFQVTWAWDPFRWLDTNRLPTLGEGPGDWLHANSLAWSPSDGDLIVSLRSQDWVVKVDYRNGAGDGHVVWRLGPGGDFAIQSSDPSPWFTHQHDVRYVNATTLVVFDDGNTRRATDPNAQSRGQELVLDERTRQATLVVNADLGSYSPAVGSAQILPGGSLGFTSGWQASSAGLNGQTVEVRPDGSRAFVQQMNGAFVYRSYFVGSLDGPSPDLVVPGARPGDLDGDGRSDLAGFKPSTSTFLALPSGGAHSLTVQFGTPGATTPLLGDYDGDGRSDVAGFLASTSTFLIKPSSGAQPFALRFGPPGTMVPLSGDFDGDGRSDLAGFLPSTSTFLIRPSSGTHPYAVQFGTPGQTAPIVGDYDGDGRSDVAGFYPALSTFIVMPSSGAHPYAVQFGTPGQTAPIVGDYDGDGRSDVAGFLASTSTFLIRPSTGFHPFAVPFGTPGATVPLSSGTGPSPGGTVRAASRASGPSAADPPFVVVPFPSPDQDRREAVLAVIESHLPGNFLPVTRSRVRVRPLTTP